MVAIDSLLPKLVQNLFRANRMCFFTHRPIRNTFQDVYWKLEIKKTSFTLLDDTSQQIRPAFHRKAGFYHVWSVEALMCFVLSTKVISGLLPKYVL